jgi:proteasome lid subunit RPN8/RPN11
MDCLNLTPEVYDQIVEHARRALPAEAVGLLGGDANGRATVAVPLPNLAGARAFVADPFVQFNAERGLRQAGLSLLAIYHSHPGGGARLSAADRAFAERRPIAQVVLALDCPRHPGEEIRAYRVEGGAAVEIGLRVG